MRTAETIQFITLLSLTIRYAPQQVIAFGIWAKKALYALHLVAFAIFTTLGNLSSRNFFVGATIFILKDAYKVRIS